MNTYKTLSLTLRTPTKNWSIFFRPVNLTIFSSLHQLLSSHTFFFSPDLVTYKWKTEQRLSKQLQFFFFSFSPTTSLVQRLFDIFIISHLLFFFLNSRHYHNKLVALMSLLSSSSSFFITPLHCLVFLRCEKKVFVYDKLDGIIYFS